MLFIPLGIPTYMPKDQPRVLPRDPGFPAMTASLLVGAGIVGIGTLEMLTEFTFLTRVIFERGETSVDLLSIVAAGWVSFLLIPSVLVTAIQNSGDNTKSTAADPDEPFDRTGPSSADSEIRDVLAVILIGAVGSAILRITDGPVLDTQTTADIMNWWLMGATTWVLLICAVLGGVLGVVALAVGIWSGEVRKYARESAYGFGTPILIGYMSWVLGVPLPL